MRTVCVIIFLVSSITSFSQGHFLGIKGGILLSNSSPDYPFSEKSYNSSFTGGVIYEYQFEKIFVLSTEILYSQFGSKTKTILFSGSFEEETIIVKYSYNYIALPIKAGIRIGSRVAGFINLGVVPSFLTSAKYERTKQYTLETVDLSSKVYEFDFHLIVELGGDIKLNEKLLLFGSVNYQHSIRNISKPDHVFPTVIDLFRFIPQSSPVKHFGLSASLGLKFKLNNLAN